LQTLLSDVTSGLFSDSATTGIPYATAVSPIDQAIDEQAKSAAEYDAQIQNTTEQYLAELAPKDN